MPRVFVTGDVTYNSLLYLAEFPTQQPGTVFSQGFHETVGGTAAGKALNLHRLGVDVLLHGLVGGDTHGQYIRQFCTRAGLPTLFEIDPQGTQRHVNLMTHDGGRISIYAAYATFEPELNLALLQAQIAASDLVALNLSNYARHLIPLARAAGKPIWCDIHNYDGENSYHQDFIDGADVLTMSSDAIPDYRAFMQRQIAAGKQLVVCTHGRDGSTALDADGIWTETPAITAWEVQDTNGAGDAFFAGLLYGHLRDYPLAKCLGLGAVAGGMCVASPELFHPELSATRIEEEYRAHNK